MCAAYETSPQTLMLARYGIPLRPETAEVTPNDFIRPTNRVLAIGDFGNGRLELGVAKWGVPRHTGQPAINARTESIGRMRIWQNTQGVWLPGSAWIDWQTRSDWKPGRKKPRFRFAPTSGETVLFKALGKTIDGVLHVAHVTLPMPERMLWIHDRAVIPFPVGVLNDPLVPSLLEQCEGTWVPGSPEPETRRSA